MKIYVIVGIKYTKLMPYDIESTRVSQMKTLNIFFKYYLLCRSGTKLYHFST